MNAENSRLVLGEILPHEFVIHVEGTLHDLRSRNARELVSILVTFSRSSKQLGDLLTGCTTFSTSESRSPRKIWSVSDLFARRAPCIWLITAAQLRAARCLLLAWFCNVIRESTSYIVGFSLTLRSRISLRESFRSSSGCAAQNGKRLKPLP